MTKAFQIFKKYPISIICYLLYSSLCYRLLELDLQFNERLLHIKPGESGLTLGGEAAAYREISLILIACIFILVSFINAVARKKYTFYLSLSFLIVVQTIALFEVMK